MSTVTVMTAERMQEIEDTAVIGASIVGGHLIMERHNGATFDAGAIDVSVVGDLAFGIDDEVFYRYTDSASPLTLTAGIQTPMGADIMDTLDTEPAWAHWDTDADDRLIFDETGIYDILVYAVIDDPAESTGHSTIKISDSAGSGEREFDHVSGSAVRLDNQFTAMYEVGQAVRIDVKSSGNYDVSYAEVYIRKFNITMEGAAEGGGEGTGDTVIPSIDPNRYVRTVSAGTPLTLSGSYGTHTEIPTSLLDDEPGTVEWGHWDTPSNEFHFDEAGLYAVRVHFLVDSSAISTGMSAIRIRTDNDDTLGSEDRQFMHYSGLDIRLYNQITRVFEVGDAFWVEATSTHTPDVTWGEILIVKFNLGPSDPGGG